MISRYALLLPLLIAVPASAGSPSSAKVFYGDLNLVSASGQAVLERRIEAAVRKVCDEGGDRDLAMRAAARQCRIDARAAAHPKLQVAVERARAANQMAGMSAPSGS